MQDPLQNIDLVYYRTARLLIVRAEIAQLRRQVSATARVEPQSKSPSATSRSTDDLDQSLARLQLSNPLRRK
jgi:hypothetical protein